MRKIYVILALIVALFLPLTLSSHVAAQLDPLDRACQGIVVEGEDEEAPSVCQTTGDDPIAGSDGIIMNVVEILSWVVGIASILMIILGGLKFITANGDPNSISSARNTVLYAMIGVAVFLVSQLIVRFVIGRF